MQTLIGDFKVTVLALGIVMSVSCHKNESFNKAIEKHRHTLIDQVNAPKTGAPFFTMNTLNPIWKLTPATPIVEMARFDLVDQAGQKTDQSLFQGQITVVGFVFTSCSGFCPFIVRSMRAVENHLADLKISIRFVAFSVDPEHDTPAALSRFAEIHGVADKKNWTFLTGERDTIYGIVKETLASQVRKREEAETPSFVHSEHLYVFDKEARLRGILNGTRLDTKKKAHELVSQLVKDSGKGTQIRTAKAR